MFRFVREDNTVLGGVMLTQTTTSGSYVKAQESMKAVYYAVKGGSNFCVCRWNPDVTISMKAIEKYFHVMLFITR